MGGFGGIPIKGFPLNIKGYFHFQKMGDRFRYRNCDDEKLNFGSKELAVVFRRVSINDLQRGKKSLTDLSGHVMSMINDEIYNYKQINQSTFDPPHKSYSDNEVIFPLCLKHHLNLKHPVNYAESLNGVSDITIYDKRKKHFIITRNSLRIKSLFYAITEKRASY